MSKVQITDQAIKRQLTRITPEEAIAEYVWNGLDAGANKVELNYTPNGLFETIQKFEIIDNGSGIDYDLLAKKFKPFGESEKAFKKKEENIALKGKNGYGRLTFFKFALNATWKTQYIKDGKAIGYSIVVESKSLDKYEPTKPIKANNKNSGTTVEFENLTIEFHPEYIQSVLVPFLTNEFAWYLEVNKEKGVNILVNSIALEYEKNVAEKLDFEIKIPNTEIFFYCTYIHWKRKLNDEFSKFYFLNEENKLKHQTTTKLNKKGDQFYHSIIIKSHFFENFSFYESESEKNTNNLTLFSDIDDSRIYRELIKELNTFLKRKRKPFLHNSAAELIKTYEEENVMPTFGNNVWDRVRKEELETLVKELYEVEPALFVKLNTEQKKTFLNLLNIVLDSDGRENLFDILQEIVELDQHDRVELAKILKTTRLTNIVRALKLVHDRILALNSLKQLVFNHDLKANERDHLQKAIEEHYWIFGEQYNLVCAAEDKFEKALRRYSYLLREIDEAKEISHSDKQKEMDIFLVRQIYETQKLNNIIIELKNPSTIKRLGSKEFNQVKTYMDVIISTDEFNNTTNSSWDFILIGQDYDDSIAREIQNAQNHGEKDLAFKVSNYKIYIKKWSEVLLDAELRLLWLNDKLKIERDKLSDATFSIKEVVLTLEQSTAKQAAKIKLPSEKTKL
ncbi:MAG: hypothetical protein GXC78_06065 [Chitinophagaceae bacterium]|nr:hypothetical protein [Chitinophagaceae bacterium]